MFDKIFRAVMKNGTRLLFLLAIALFVYTVVNTVMILMPGLHSPVLRKEMLRNALPMLFTGLMPSGYLLLGALLVDRADKIIEHLCAARDST